MALAQCLLSIEATQGFNQVANNEGEGRAMKRIGSILAVAVACMLMAFAPAQAYPIIDFGDGGSVNGTISFDGVNYVGTDIGIKIMKVYHDSPAADVYMVTGPLAGPGGTTEGALNFDTGANTIDIVGGIASLGIPDDTVLMSGSFYSFHDSNPAVNALSFYAAGPDEKDFTLLRKLGISTGTKWAFFGFSISAIDLSPAGEPGTLFAATSFP